MPNERENPYRIHDEIVRQEWGFDEEIRRASEEIRRLQATQKVEFVISGDGRLKFLPFNDDSIRFNWIYGTNLSERTIKIEENRIYVEVLLDEKHIYLANRRINVWIGNHTVLYCNPTRGFATEKLERHLNEDLEEIKSDKRKHIESGGETGRVYYTATYPSASIRTDWNGTIATVSDASVQANENSPQVTDQPAENNATANPLTVEGYNRIYDWFESRQSRPRPTEGSGS